MNIFRKINSAGKKFIAFLEESDFPSSVLNKLNHANRAVLDKLIGNGSAQKYFGQDGQYHDVPTGGGGELMPSKSGRFIYGKPTWADPMYSTWDYTNQISYSEMDSLSESPGSTWLNISSATPEQNQHYGAFDIMVGHSTSNGAEGSWSVSSTHDASTSASVSATAINNFGEINSSNESQAQIFFSAYDLDGTPHDMVIGIAANRESCISTQNFFIDWWGNYQVSNMSGNDNSIAYWNTNGQLSKEDTMSVVKDMDSGATTGLKINYLSGEEGSGQVPVCATSDGTLVRGEFPAPPVFEQVQADFTMYNSADPSYIKHKPFFPKYADAIMPYVLPQGIGAVGYTPDQLPCGFSSNTNLQIAIKSVHAYIVRTFEGTTNYVGACHCIIRPHNLGVSFDFPSQTGDQVYLYIQYIEL